MKNLLILIFALAFGHNTVAQIQKHAQWKYSFANKEVKVGDKVDLIFDVTIDNGWYMYSSDIGEDVGPLPTTVTFEPSDAFVPVGKLRPVKPKKKYDEVWKAEITYFTGKAQFRQTVKVLKLNPVIKGTADFQTCTIDNGVCVPGSTDFELSDLKVIAASATSINVEEQGGTEKPLPVTKEVLPSVVARDSIVPPSAADSGLKASTSQPVGVEDQIPTGTVPEDQSLWGFAVTAFLAGLVALLTPCVFPVIPMTVTFFTKQKKGKRNAFIYGFFIVLIYTLIGVVVSRINGPAFANFLSTHWIPNLAFFIIFLLFGLSFLGMFELIIPTSFVNKMDSKADQGGIAGIFFMAFTLVLISFSCTGPIAGSLLVASAGGQVLKPIVGMMAYSAAFAIPFTLFALFPDWLKGLPKSGGWLNTVKVVLGFLELALALKFLSIADQVYHWHILDREVFLAFWIVIFGMLGFYFLGKIRTPHDFPLEFVNVPRILLAIVTFTFVVYMIPGMWGAPLKALAGYLPPQTTHDFDLSKGVSGMGPKSVMDEQPKYADLFKLPHGLEGFFDYNQGLAYGKKVGKPVFIDFTGHGCVNCREMEARVWSDPEVLKRLNEDYVIVALYVDDKKELPESQWYTSTYDNKVKKTIGAQNADIQIVKFNNNAQPHYCLVDHEGRLLATPVNYDLNAGNFVKFLDSGKKAFEERRLQ